MKRATLAGARLETGPINSVGFLGKRCQHDGMNCHSFSFLSLLVAISHAQVVASDEIEANAENLRRFLKLGPYVQPPER